MIKHSSIVYFAGLKINLTFLSGTDEEQKAGMWEGAFRGGGAALTSENMGSFLAKSTTRVMAGVMILVNSLKASRSTLSPSDVGATGDCPIFSGCGEKRERHRLTGTNLIQMSQIHPAEFRVRAARLSSQV